MTALAWDQMVQRAGVFLPDHDEPVRQNDSVAPVTFTGGLWLFYYYAYETLTHRVGEQATRHSIRQGFIPLVHSIQCAWCYQQVSVLNDKPYGRPRQVCGRSRCTEERKRAGYRDGAGRYARLTQPERHLPPTTGHSLDHSPAAGAVLERSQVPDRWGRGTENQEAHKRIKALEPKDRAVAEWFTKSAVAKWRDENFDPAAFDEWDYPTWAIEVVRTACENAYLTERERAALRASETREAKRKAGKRVAQQKSEKKLKDYKAAWDKALREAD